MTTKSADAKPRGAPPATWVIEQTDSKGHLSYWLDCDLFGGFASIVTGPLGPPDGVGTVRTWGTKADAEAAFRKVYGRMARGYRAVRLTDEQVARLTPPGANTKPVPDTVAAALAKARAKKAAPADTTPTEIVPQRATEPVTPGADAQAAPAVPDVTDKPLTKAAARALTDEIKRDAEVLWEKIAQAFTERAWAALGYPSWDGYCAAEFGSLRLRLPREERSEVVSSLADAGLSNRAIATATGISEMTVRREKAAATNVAPVIDAEIVTEAPVSNETPGRKLTVVREPARTVTGTDGKRYASSRVKPPRQRQRDVFKGAANLAVLTCKVADEVDHLKNLGKHKGTPDEVAKLLEAIRHLRYAQKILDKWLATNVIDKPTGNG
ncbi:hypothetical protein [Mycobacterium sp. 29Ha]|uniref:hypothetical protein n=1 Tax=Mycobacterium sp. 29Ha TaxID=2939268 RepID=UPI0029390B90|nr:hypothetical protein [Mycobacterium sp. 29Ha]MDV3134109.1 hypothetical protein [Mycobacterium sp. 29Ha]